MNSTDNITYFNPLEENELIEGNLNNNLEELSFENEKINDIEILELEKADTPKEVPNPEDNDSTLTAHYLHIIKGEATKEYISGYNPLQIRKAYRFNNIYTGKGQTIAIVSAFNYPTLKNDLDVFSRQFHLPPADVKIIFARGTQPPVDAGWAMETALDVQWAHALAPKAKILVVLAASNTFADLFQAVDVAAQAGANVISMSWGGAEFSGESAWDSHLKHPGTAYVAGSGDIGGNTLYPSVSRCVLSAGGTSLWLDKYGKRLSEERVWTGGGGGPSAFILVPSWQKKFKSVSEKTKAFRGTPDVSFDADLVTGVAIYNSTPYNGISGWIVTGGTSLSAPCWAAIIACMGQWRRRFKNVIEYLYKIAGDTDYNKPQKFFIDITNGTAGTFSAEPGWDFCTGLGSPNVDLLCKRSHRFSPFAWLRQLLSSVKKKQIK